MSVIIISLMGQTLKNRLELYAGGNSNEELYEIYILLSSNTKKISSLQNWKARHLTHKNALKNKFYIIMIQIWYTNMNAILYV